MFLKKIPNKKSKILNEVFREKKNKDHAVAACAWVYRDVLIFKKKSKTLGVAKICFGCGHHYIVGTDADTGQFGANGEYKKLEELLK